MCRVFCTLHWPAFLESSHWPKLSFGEKSVFSPWCEGEHFGKFVDTSQGHLSMLPYASVAWSGGLSGEWEEPLSLLSTLAANVMYLAP